jgi:hypothetical protein
MVKSANSCCASFRSPSTSASAAASPREVKAYREAEAM